MAFSRKGLHRLECQVCDGFVYATVANLEAQMERYGRLPACQCGEDVQPNELELALLLGLDDAPVVVALFDRADDKERSQLRSLGRNRVAQKRWAGTLNDMTSAAFTEIVAERREQARSRQVAALRPIVEPMPF